MTFVLHFLGMRCAQEIEKCDGFLQLEQFSLTYQFQFTTGLLEKFIQLVKKCSTSVELHNCPFHEPPYGPVVN